MGERAHGEYLRNHGQNRTLISAISLDGVLPSLLVNGSMTREVFVYYLREFLLPEVEVVKVMDLFLHMLIHQLEVVLVVVVEVLIILLCLLQLQNEDWVMILQLVLHKEILPV